MEEVIEIIDSKSERARLVQRTDVLDKVKALATLPGHGVATTAQVAEFYEVPLSTVRDLVKAHRGELSDNGYRVVSGDEMREMKEGLSRDFRLKVDWRRSVALWDRRAVLNLGMLLRDSEVAKEVRRYLLNVEEKAHEHATSAQSSEHQTLAEGLAKFLEQHFVTRSEFEALKADLSGTPIKRTAKISTSQRLPDRGSLADIMGIPSERNGKLLEHGIGRDGRPWAAYGTGKGREWLPRADVIAAYQLLGGSK